MALALGIAHLLYDYLLGGLRRDPAEIYGRQRVGDEIADLRFGIKALRCFERDLGRLVLDGLDDLAEAQQTDLAVAPVDLGPDVVFLAVFRAPGLLDGLLHRFQHLIAVDAFVARDGVGNLQQLVAPQHRLGAPEIDDDIAEFDALDEAVDDFALCPGDRGERQANLARLADQADMLLGASEQPPAEAFAAVERRHQIDPGFEPGEAVVIFRPHQRTIDPRRADFKQISPGDRVGHIEQRRNRAADASAIIDGHRRLVTPLRHHLKGRPLRAGQRNPHQAIPHRLKRRLDDAGNLVRIDRQPIPIPAESADPNKKAGRRAHSNNWPSQGSSPKPTLWDFCGDI